MVHRNSANLVCTFRIYVCLRLCDRDCCSAADGSGSCHAPAPSYFEEMTRFRRQIQWRTERCRRQKHGRRLLGSIEISQIYAYENKQSVSKNSFLLLRTTPRLTALRTVNFPAITRNGFCFHIRKIISRPPGPPRKNRVIHIVGFFCRFYL